MELCLEATLEGLTSDRRRRPLQPVCRPDAPRKLLPAIQILPRRSPFQTLPTDYGSRVAHSKLTTTSGTLLKQPDKQEAATPLTVNPHCSPLRSVFGGWYPACIVPWISSLSMATVLSFATCTGANHISMGYHGPNFLYCSSFGQKNPSRGHAAGLASEGKPSGLKRRG